MIYLAKLLPAFLMPLGLGLGLLLLGLFFKKRIFSFFGISILFFFGNGLTAALLMRLAEDDHRPQRVADIEKAGAIVVLSGMLDQRPGIPLGEWADGVDRFEAGLDLWQAKKAPFLVFTGGKIPWRPRENPEGDLLKERAVIRGVSKDSIRVTGKAGNTAEEAVAVRELIETMHRQRPEIGRRIILVTSASHMSRARQLFILQGLEVQPFAVDFQPTEIPPSIGDFVLCLLPRASYLHRSEVAVRELMGRAFYRLKNWVLRTR